VNRHAGQKALAVLIVQWRGNLLQQIIALLEEGGGACITSGGEDAVTSQIDEKGVVVPGMRLFRQRGQDGLDLRPGASQIALRQGNVRQTSLRFGGQRPHPGCTRKLGEGGKCFLEGRRRPFPLPYRRAHMAQDQGRINQPEENITASFVDLVGLFGIAERLLRGARIVRLDRGGQATIELTLFG